MRSVVVLLLMIATRSSLAEPPGEATSAEARIPALHPVLLKRVRLHPCEFLAAALADRPDGRKVCGRLRHENGELVVGIVASDGKEEYRPMKRGQKCSGGLVGPDLRPGKEPRGISYLEITLKGEDEKTLAFVGWLRMYQLLPDGTIGGVIGKGCGAELGGRMRLSRNGWHLVGERMKGCSD